MLLLRERQIDNVKTETDQHVHRTSFSIQFRNMDINQIHGRVDQDVLAENKQDIVLILKCPKPLRNQDLYKKMKIVE